MWIEPFVLNAAQETGMLSHVIIESIYILEHFQKDVMAVGKNGATDGYPLILSEYRLLLGLLPIAVLNEPFGTFPYVLTHDLYRMAGGCILISHERRLLKKAAHSLPRQRRKIN
jgi:hypothetical protein